ncbi:interleukin-13 receptor subunit alpha-2 [Aulostomus maculatus]
MAAHRLTLLLLFIMRREERHCQALSVDPPESIDIYDPGHLGRLDITWRPPASLHNLTECPQMYQLEYFDSYQNSWTAIRTPARTYTAQFDLMKDVSVRVYTLLSGPCTNGHLVTSSNYTELVWKAPSTGVADTAVKDFTCVFYNMMYVKCTWERSPKTPANSQHNLYFWHKELQQTKECPKYLLSNGVQTGCDFTGKPLPEFTDVSFCVNGSSPEGPLKPTYITLQIQNHVKPDTTGELHLQTGSDAQLELRWTNPAGRVPKHCLEWEVEHNQEGRSKKTILISTEATSLTLPSVSDNLRNCFRVRCRLDKYCTETSFWSDWSRQICHPKEIPSSAEPQQEPVSIFVYLAAVIITALLLLLGVWEVLKMRNHGQVKKLDPLTASAGRSSAL